VPLAAATISPFGPQPGGRAIGEDSGDDQSKSGSGSGADPGSGSGSVDRDGEPKRPAVTVDTDGMPARVVTLPVSESRYSCLRAVKGGLAWLAEPLNGTLGEGGARP